MKITFDDGTHGGYVSVSGTTLRGHRFVLADQPALFERDAHGQLANISPISWTYKGSPGVVRELEIRCGPIIWAAGLRAPMSVKRGDLLEFTVGALELILVWDDETDAREWF